MGWEMMHRNYQDFKIQNYMKEEGTQWERHYVKKNAYFFYYIGNPTHTVLTFLQSIHIHNHAIEVLQPASEVARVNTKWHMTTHCTRSRMLSVLSGRRVLLFFSLFCVCVSA